MAGIFGDYQFDPGSFSGILGSLLSPMMGQQLPAQVPSGFGPSAPAAAPQMPAIPPNAYAQAGPAPQQPIPQAPPQASGPGFGDRAMAALSNFANGGGVLPAIAGAITGATTGQRTDPVGLMLQQQQAAYQALVPSLVANGMPIQQAVPLAKLAAINPEVMKVVSPNLYTKPEFHTLTGMTGEQIPVFTNANNQTITYPTASGAQGGAESGVPTSLGPALTQIQQMHDSGATPEQMLSAVPQAIRPYVQGLLEGRALPASLGMRSQGRQAIMTFAQAMGLDEGQIKARMQFANDIGNTKSGLGFRLEAGQKMLNHMEELSTDALAMHNRDVPSGPLGYVVPGSVIQGINAVGNNQPEQRNAASRMATTAGSYAQEKGKFLSGISGGTGAEREKTVNDYNPNLPTSNLAGTLQGDMDLFRGQFGAMTMRRDQQIGVNSDNPRFAIVTPGMEAQMQRIQKNIDKLRTGQGGTEPQKQATQAAPQKASTGDALSQARDAIARGAPRDAVIQRLKQNGINPTGL